ncbi:hypothetical protein T484DRAFT_1889661, partial [Baffinella frigidus]
MAIGRLIRALLVLLAWLPASTLAGLEATLIVVDTSEGMVSGDHMPSRLQAQFECVNLVCNAKTENPESGVGLMSMTVDPEKDYDCPMVHLTPMNTEPWPVVKKLAKLNERPRFFCQFEDAMEVAWMCLNTRFNKAQKPRIIAFVGTPVKWKDPRALVQFGKKLRKAGCAIDIVSFGASPKHNDPVLKAFVAAMDKDGNSHFLSLPAEAVWGRQPRPGSGAGHGVEALSSRAGGTHRARGHDRARRTTAIRRRRRTRGRNTPFTKSFFFGAGGG